MREFLSIMVLSATLAATPASGAGPFEEPAVRTEHEITLGGDMLMYSAETGRIAIRDAETGEPHGQMFYIAYRAPSIGPRPVAFIWNGGPGANSALLHFEAAGPRRLDEQGQLVDNQDTWLTNMDLVFVDPIGTGFSRPTKAEYADEFYGTIGDVASVTEFVRAWRVVHMAEESPILLIGESWGAGRAGSVGFRLEEQGIPVHALVLISGGTGLADNPVPTSLRRALWIADLSTTAFYHDRLPPDLVLPPDNPAESMREATTAWAHRVYAPALERVDSLSDEDRQALQEGLQHYSGMPADAIDPATLRITPRAYRENLLRDSEQVLQLFDMRLIVGEGSEEGPSRADTITRYLRNDLGYTTSLPYVGLEPLESAYAPGGEFPQSVNARWNYATADLTPEETEAAIQEAIRTGAGPPRLGPPLPSAAEAVGLNSDIEVWVAAGRFDSLNSCIANEELGRRLEGDLQQAYTFACYEGGHMMYRDPEARVALARDVRQLARSAR
jgi:carboxypeptidase C (cathepsin A)